MHFNGYGVKGFHMNKKIYILGGSQSDFSTNWTRSEKSLFDIFCEVVLNGLEDAKLDPKDIDVGHVGNFVAELFTGQGMLGGYFGHVHEDFQECPPLDMKELALQGL